MNQSSSGGSAVFSIIYFIVIIAIYILTSLPLMKIANKKGLSGILAWIPVANVILILQIAGKPLWWIILCFIPFVSFIMYFVIGVAFFKAINKAWFWLLIPGLIFIPLWQAAKE